MIWKNFLRDFPLRGVSRLKQRDGAMKLRPTRKKNMKTKILLLGAVITAFTFTTLAADALLTPRQMDNQPKTVNSSVATPVATVVYVTPKAALLTPRAADNQSKVVKGVANDSNPALACAKMMGASPKAVSECSSHTTMPGCQTGASMKWPAPLTGLSQP